MTKCYSKLLAAWPRHQSRGIAVFILGHGMLPITVPWIGVGFLSRLFLFNRHAIGWDEVAYICVTGIAVGVFRGAFLWHKMEREYAAVSK